MEIQRTIKYSDGGMATGLVGEDQVKDLSFKIRVKEMPKSDTISLHEVVTIEPFDLGDEKNIVFSPFHMIFGDSSLAIFDALGVDEVAGLKREDCVEFLENLKKQGKTERDGSFIAGLCNFSGKNIFMFFNVQRLNFKGFASRVLPHEALHLARLLITLKENKWIKDNLTTPEWYLDPKAAFVDMNDNNEEFFAETLERTSAIAMDAWQRITGEKCYMDGGGIEDETKDVSDEYIDSIIEDISDYKIYGSAEGNVDAETITFYGDYKEEDKNYNIEIVFKVDDPYADYEYVTDDPDETEKMILPSYHLQSIILIEDDMYNIQLTESQKEKISEAIEYQFNNKIAAAYDYAMKMDAYESQDETGRMEMPRKYFMKHGGGVGKSIDEYVDEFSDLSGLDKDSSDIIKIKSILNGISNMLSGVRGMDSTGGNHYHLFFQLKDETWIGFHSATGDITISEKFKTFRGIQGNINWDKVTNRVLASGSNLEIDENIIINDIKNKNYERLYAKGGGVGMAMEGMFLDDEFERMVEKLKNYLAKYPYIWTRGTKRYVPIEGWQYAAALMGLSSRVKNVNEIQPGVWQAEADVVDKRSGVVNCSGFAIINKAEHKWAKKDEDIINFVQTRAVSRALRNCISYLIKAAGYSTTPAEEMYGLASEEKKKKGMPSSIKPVKGVSEDDFIFDRPEYNEGMTQPPFPKEEVPITKYVPREEIPQEDMLRKVWAESKANGIVIRSAEFMNEIELALTDETIGTEMQIKSLLMESYNWLTENGIVLRSKIFMKKFKDSL